MSDSSDQSPFSQPDPSPFSDSAQPQFPQAAYAPPPPAQPQPTNTPGLVGFILSLTGLIAPCMFPIGMIVSLFGMGKQPKGLAIAGLIIGAIGSLILFAVLLIYGAMIFACIGLASTMQPVMETENAIMEASTQIEDYYFENDEYPDDATGNSLISGITDGWEHALQYELDEDAVDGYIIRSPGADGVFDTDDDQTSENIYDGDDDELEDEWEELERDESDMDETELDFGMEEDTLDGIEEIGASDDSL